MKFAMFSKHLQQWPLEMACREVRDAGFDGLDLTVRQGGYVEPADAIDGIPAAVRVARDCGLDVPLVTTGLLSASDPYARIILSAAADVGVAEVKVHYWPLEYKMDIDQIVAGTKRYLDDLVRIAEQTGIRINLHNHSGDCVQHSAWAIKQLVEDYPPHLVGVYFDPAHYTIEGGLAGWQAAIQLLRDRITLLAVKDFRWVDVNKSEPQERRWVPVGTGNVQWKQILMRLGNAGFSGWVSVHGEYQGRWSYKELGTSEVLAQAALDRTYLEGLYKSI